MEIQLAFYAQLLVKLKIGYSTRKGMMCIFLRSQPRDVKMLKFTIVVQQ